MKKLMMLIAVFGFVGVGTVHAEETVGEKAVATGHDAKRAVKKGANRVKEAVCMENDAKCLAKKGKHRLQEGGDYVKDKAVEAKNAVDSDGE